MPQVLSRPSRERVAHPLQDSLAAITFVLGVLALVMGLIHSAHLAAAIVGFAGFFLGLYSQMISATTAERWINVMGIGAAFVGLGLGMGHGGFSL